MDFVPFSGLDVQARIASGHTGRCRTNHRPDSSPPPGSKQRRTVSQTIDDRTLSAAVPMPCRTSHSPAVAEKNVGCYGEVPVQPAWPRHPKSRHQESLQTSCEGSSECVANFIYYSVQFSITSFYKADIYFNHLSLVQ